MTAIIYTRVAAGDPDALVLARQLATVTAAAVRAGYTVAATVAETRPGGVDPDALVRLAVNRGATAVFVASLDRLGRSPRTMAALVSALAAAGVAVVTVDNGPVDTGAAWWALVTGDRP